jgi:DNA-binding response OmpR family regulator
MPALRVLLVGPADTVSAMALLLYRSHHETRWETEGKVTSEDVDWCDVIIADIGLKGQAGRDFAKALASEQAKRPLVIVISSDSVTPPVQAGIDANLTKPIDPDELVGCVERLGEFYAALKADEAASCLTLIEDRYRLNVRS